MKLKLPEISLKATGLTNLFDVDNHIRKMLGPVINQINRGKSDEGELAEVIKVYSTEDQLEESPVDDEPDYKFIGAIRFRKIYSQQHLSDDQLMVAYPLNLNIVDFPVKGETVFIQKIYNKFYYTDRINIYNNPNNSSSVGSSQKFNIGKSTKSQQTLDTAESEVVENKETLDDVFLGDYFKPNFNIRSLIPNEGDTLIQGRFGNTLRLGSVDNAPTIKLRAGQISDYEKFDEGETLINELNEKAVNTSLEENINLDASSMWMTTDETVSLTPATLEDPNIYPTSVVPEEFGGKQIILNSGRLIFNSKESGILGFSNGPIDFSTLDVFGVSAKLRLDLYSPIISVGRRDKTKNINLNTSNVTVRGDSGKTLIRANKIRLLGPVEGEDIRRAGKLQPVVRPVTNEFGTKGKEAASFIVAPGGKDIQVTPAVKGDELKEVLEQMLAMQKVTTKAIQDINQQILTPVLAALAPLVAGATSRPLQVTAETIANITTNILDDINIKIESLPKILSKVVEIE